MNESLQRTLLPRTANQILGVSTYLFAVNIAAKQTKQDHEKNTETSRKRHKTTTNHHEHEQMRQRKKIMSQDLNLHNSQTPIPRKPQNYPILLRGLLAVSRPQLPSKLYTAEQPSQPCPADHLIGLCQHGALHLNICNADRLPDSIMLCANEPRLLTPPSAPQRLAQQVTT